jgi:hypothetical protein
MARKIYRGYDALFSGAPVFWKARADCGLLGLGFLFGSIWDTDNNGEVIQFQQGNFYARYFIKTEDLVKGWDVPTQRFVIDDARLLVMAEEFHPLERTKKHEGNKPRAFCTRNRKSVAIWTYYY